MKDNIGKNHLLTRFILIFNIIFISITIILFIVFNNTLLDVSLPIYLRKLLEKMNILIFFFSAIIVFLNAYLLINHLFYNTKQYFKLAEKIDFNDLPTTLGILHNLPSTDEYGALGSRVTKLLRIYLNYAHIIKKRLMYKDSMMKMLIKESNIPVLIFEHKLDQKNYYLDYVSPAAKEFLKLENFSSILGKTFTTLLSKDSHARIQSLLNNLEKEKTTTSSISIRDTLEWLQVIEKDGIKEEQLLLLEATLMPFVFEFADDYQYKDQGKNSHNINHVIDYFAVLLHQTNNIEEQQAEKMTFIDDDDEDELSSIPDPTFEDLNIDEHL